MSKTVKSKSRITHMIYQRISDRRGCDTESTLGMQRWAVCG